MTDPSSLAGGDVEQALVPPPHPTPEDISRASHRYWLFGYPISHSASPAFQNCILQSLYPDAGSRPTYALCDTLSVSDSHFGDRIRRDERFGGAGVTMPLKVSVTQRLGPGHALDELDDVARKTGSVNTIVVVPGPERRHVGTNTDYLGIRQCLTRAAQLDASGRFAPAEDGAPCAGFVVGAGGACRSAVLALHHMGLSPIYLINRDRDELRDVVAHFAAADPAVTLCPLYTMAEWVQLRETAGPVAAGVSAIPAVEPVSDAEKMVWIITCAFFRDPRISGVGPRFFLDMCYKPRETPMLRYAADHGWSTIGGVEAMIEQGLAQARMWATSATAAEADVSSILRAATRAGDSGPLSAAAEDKARHLALNMDDIIV
ncbi:NAD(P)-binding protein [Auricularia subglabra TFB-10046 SS5]|nr:NAD(P)-binding protein [Auricularia subglabra TFB-10046 SS5]